jgi:hypothetical protein
MDMSKEELAAARQFQSKSWINRIKWFYKAAKSQLSSTKLQINLKLQYPMTKTFTVVGPYRFAMHTLPKIMPFVTNIDQSFFINFS